MNEINAAFNAINDGIVKGDCYLFWKDWAAQWYVSEFSENGVTYNSCEQYMMASKAKLFGDEEVYAAIMAAQTPKEQKALGRAVKGFDEAVWTKKSWNIVYNGNCCKFLQNPELRRKLLDTKELRLVEASPYDKIWGIGMAADHEDATNHMKWQGSNLLGIALERVRHTIQLIDQIDQMNEIRKNLENETNKP